MFVLFISLTFGFFVLGADFKVLGTIPGPGFNETESTVTVRVALKQSEG